MNKVFVCACAVVFAAGCKMAMPGLDAFAAKQKEVKQAAYQRQAAERRVAEAMRGERKSTMAERQAAYERRVAENSGKALTSSVLEKRRASYKEKIAEEKARKEAAVVSENARARALGEQYGMSAEAVKFHIRQAERDGKDVHAVLRERQAERKRQEALAAEIRKENAARAAKREAEAAARVADLWDEFAGPGASTRMGDWRYFAGRDDMDDRPYFAASIENGSTAFGFRCEEGSIFMMLFTGKYLGGKRESVSVKYRVDNDRPLDYSADVFGEYHSGAILYLTAPNAADRVKVAALEALARFASGSTALFAVTAYDGDEHRARFSLSGSGNALRQLAHECRRSLPPRPGS